VIKELRHGERRDCGTVVPQSFLLPHNFGKTMLPRDNSSNSLPAHRVLVLNYHPWYMPQERVIVTTFPGWGVTIQTV